MNIYQFNRDMFNKKMTTESGGLNKIERQIFDILKKFGGKIHYQINIIGFQLDFMFNDKIIEVLGSIHTYDELIDNKTLLKK